MKVVYIAGKYRGPTPWAVEQNIRAAEDVAAKVIQAGHMPLCPHKNTAHMEGLADDAFFLEGTKELLRRCDAVLCVSNWRDSVGARGEVEEARRLGLPVFGTDRALIDSAVADLSEWAADISAGQRPHAIGLAQRMRSHVLDAADGHMNIGEAADTMGAAADELVRLVWAKRG